MTATEKDALKNEAVTALRKAIAEGADPALIAKAIGREYETLGRFLTGVSKPSPETARLILKACGR